MGFWDQLEDGVTDIAGGVGGFVVDSAKAGREFGNFNFMEGLGIVVGSFQEDLLGQALAGAIGPEGIGGTLLSQVPEPVRKPIGTVTSPVLGYLDWSIQELVDRPLGTVATVVNAVNPVNGKHSILDLNTWSRAWDINDKRTFGQSLAASLYMIDPFNDEEYNSIQDDPLFDLISGTADFVQELIDPTLLAGGAALKFARGSTVISAGSKTVGRSFVGSGSSRMSKYLAPRGGNLEPSHIVGGRTGLRPSRILNRDVKFLTKTDKQRNKLNEIKKNVAAQRARNVAASPFAREVFGDAVDAAAKAKALERSEFLDKKAEADEFNYDLGGEEPSGVLDANERFGVIRTALGAAGRNLPDEAIRLIANGDTTAKRLNTFRILAGDFSTFEDAAVGASLVLSEMKAMQNRAVPNEPVPNFGNTVQEAVDGEKYAPNRVEEPLGNVGDFSFSPEAQNVIDSFDFALFDAFEHNLLLSQRRSAKPTYTNQAYNFDPRSWDTLNEMPVDTTILALEQMLGQVDNILGDSALTVINKEAVITNALRTNVLPRQIKELPFGRRLQELARQHRLKAKKDGAAYSEHVNPNTAFGSTKAIRWITERLPFTHIFFTEANVVDQFERVLTQASRIEDGKVLANAGIDVNKVLGEFTALKLQKDYAMMADTYTNTIQRINNSLDRLLEGEEFDFGSLAGVDVNHRTYNEMWGQAAEGWVNERTRIIGLTNPEGEVPTALQPGRTVDDPLFDAVVTGDSQVTVEAGLRVIRDENADVIIQQFGFSPSQIEQSAVLPRYDIIDKEIKVWRDQSTSARVERAKKKAEKEGTNVGKAVERAVVPPLERLVGPLRHPANQAHSYWRKGVLSTPKWPMRVQLDEQFRIAANIGAVSTIANFANGFERMREAQAVHKMDNWDELKKTRLLEDGMIKYAAENELKIEGSGFDAVYRAVGKKGFEAAVKDVTQKLVLDGRTRARLKRNYVTKAVLFGTFMGNPIMGAAYGLVSKGSRLRRINNSAQKTAGLHYAGALKIEGRKLLNEASTPDDLNAARAMMSDAEFIEANINNETVQRASNAFESAEELLIKAGFQGISIGKSTLRNAFGDDGRFIEQIEASNSANEALSSIYRSAHDSARRDLEQYKTDYAVRDYLELQGSSSEPFETAFAQMMNRMTTASSNEKFYDIVWGEGPAAERIDALTQLFEADTKLFNDLSRNALDLEQSGWSSIDDYQILATQIIREFDEVLPPQYFGEARKNARAGDTGWTHIEDSFPSIYSQTVGDLEGLKDVFEDDVAGYKAALRKEVIEKIREENPEFGKTFTSRTIISEADKGFASWVDDQFDNIFSVLAEIPSDQLSRHPFFKSVYERELRRMVEPMVDSDGMVALSQKKINEFEAFAREQALTETRTLLYDLRETTRAAETLANVAPFFNAWQEVIGRWAGLASDNPTFVANVARLYTKEWSAEALGLSEVEDENGNKYLTFRLTGTAYDEEGNEQTIFDAMPDSVKNFLIPAPLRSTNDTVRFSKDSLNTMLQGSPGVGPMITIPAREAITATPELEETLAFMFPFGHPQGGVIDRMFIANLPSWAKAVNDVMTQTHRHDAVRTRMYRDLVIEAQASGEFIDWNDEAVWRDFEEEAQSRTNNWFLFKFGSALMSPASTTLISSFEPLKQEYRELQKEHGGLIAEDMFLTKYGEDFHALTSALSRSNDGIPASVKTEQLRDKHKDLIEVLGDSGVGAYVVGAVGSNLEQLRYSQSIQNQQFLEPVAPGSKTMRRELYTGRELIETSQARLGWREYAEVADWVKSKQDEADAAGLSTNLGAAHMRPVSAVKQLRVSQIAENNPAWAAEYNDVLSSTEKRISINDAFMKVLADPVVSRRDSALHIAEYYRKRQWIQGKLEERKAAGGSANLERSGSNADLLMLWENIRTELSLRPQFSAVFDRYFTRDMISEATFIEADEWPEGFLING